MAQSDGEVDDDEEAAKSTRRWRKSCSMRSTCSLLSSERARAELRWTAM